MSSVPDGGREGGDKHTALVLVPCHDVGTVGDGNDVGSR
jgi:hypothetical protein